MMTLTDLANRYNSDKGDQVGCCHQYALLYQELFESIREQPISFLEIGLQREFCQEKPDCPSLRMWLDFFPEAEISGFDISDFSDVELPRAKIFQGDQSDPARLKEVAEETGPFDIIIDDGSHASAHQQITLGTLFPYLKPGGLFVIEDAHWQPWRDQERKDGIETMQSIMTRVAIDGKPFASQLLTNEQCRYIESNVAKCTFSHPFIDDRPKGNQPSTIRSMARRMLKGKLPSEDHRKFKLIILTKVRPDDSPSRQCMTAQLTSDAV